MFPLIGLLAGAALGGIKHFASDAPGRERDKKLNAEITRWSPWTGMANKPERDANLFGSLLQGGAMGGLMQAGMGAMGGGAAGGQSGAWDTLMKGMKTSSVDALAPDAVEGAAGVGSGASALAPGVLPETAMGYGGGAGTGGIGMWNSMLNNPYYRG